MRGFLFLSILIALPSITLEAREDVVLTVPKSGTQYLRMIIENITNCDTIPPTVPQNYKKEYDFCQMDEETIVFGHCEPWILNFIPLKEDLLLLIRDPRDVALSAVDYIDKRGLTVWPGLLKIIDPIQWNLLSKKKKLLMILDDFYDDRRVSVINLFETAIYLIQNKKCFVVKYESLSPEYATLNDLTATIQDISCFFGEKIDSLKAESIIKNCFRNSSSETLNKGIVFRYLNENDEIKELLESRLYKYIEYFNYPLTRNEQKKPEQASMPE